jgi:hypothetical protein
VLASLLKQRRRRFERRNLEARPRPAGPPSLGFPQEGPAHPAPRTHPLQGKVPLFERSVLKAPHLLSVLVALHSHVLAAAAPLHRAARLGAAHAALLLLGRRAAAAGAAQYLAAMLVQQLPEPEAQPAAAALLAALLHRVLAFADAPAGGAAARSTALALLGSLLQSTTAAATGAIEVKLAALRAAAARRTAQGLVAAGRSATAVALPAGDPLVALLSGVLATVPAAPLRSYLRTLDPLPPLPALAGAAAVLSEARGAPGLREELTLFAARAGGMAPAARGRALTALKGRLGRDEAQLLAPAPEPSRPQGEPAYGGRRLQPEVEAAAWRLARLGAAADDAGLSGLAARLLAVAGPLPPEVIAYLRADEGDGGGGSLVASALAAAAATPAAPDELDAAGGSGRRRGGGSGSEASPTGDASRDAMLYAVLEILGGRLAGPDPATNATVQSVARALLATPQGRAALQQLQERIEAARAAAGAGAGAAAAAGRALTVCYLAALRTGADEAGGHGGAVSGGPPALEAPALEVGDAQLWNPVGASPGLWLCRLAASLLAACGRDPLLALLAPAAALLPEAAEALLPHAVLELVGAGEGVHMEGEPAAGLPPMAARTAISAALASALAAGAAAAAAALPGSAVARGAGPMTVPPRPASRASSLNQSSSFGRALSAASAAAATAAIVAAAGGGGGGSKGAGDAKDVRQCLRVLLRVLDFLRGVHRNAMVTCAWI